MDTRQAFLAAIQANPTDWLVYGVFADWLDENGETELAEGIRAMGRLRVCVGPIYGEVNSFTLEDQELGNKYIRKARKKGNYYDMASSQWRASCIKYKSVYFLSEYTSTEAIAIAYSRMSWEDKVETERILGDTNND